MHTIVHNGKQYLNFSIEQLVASGVPDSVIQESLWKPVRQQRNQLLSACDWTQMPDSPLSDAEKAAWADYRQQLRDLTENNDNPDAVVWPSEPTA